MNYLKINFIVGALTVFAIACGQTQSVNNSTAMTNTTTANVNAVSDTQSQPNGAVLPSNDDLAAAGKIYSEKCVNCHKENGLGGVTVLKDGSKVKAPNFASERMRKDDDKDWIEAIENGVKEDGMPAYKGKISDEDIKNLVKFIRHEFQRK
jgi:mono/diheme cytochrome c family protein